MSTKRLTPDERAARAIRRALAPLLPAERERALGAVFGRTSSDARIARLEMGLRAARIAMPTGYREPREIIDTALEVPS